MLKFLNKYLFIPFFVILFSLMSFIPNNNYGGYVSGLDKDIVIPEFNYTNTQRDNLGDGIAGVNSAVKQNGYGFDNLNIGFRYDWDNYNGDPGPFGTVELNSKVDIPDIDYLVQYGESLGFTTFDFVKIKYSIEILPGDSGSFNLVDDYGSYYLTDNFVTVYDFRLDYLLETIGFTLVDRDIDTDFEGEVKYTENGESEPMSNFGKFSLNSNFGFGIDFPTYSYVRSMLLSIPIFKVRIGYLTNGGTDPNPNLRSELSTYFLPVGVYDYDKAVAVGKYDTGLNVDNIPQSGTHEYNSTMSNHVNVLKVPDEYLFQGSYTFVFDIGVNFNNNAPGNELSKTILTNQFYLSEFNVFSDDPVIGGFAGGNIEYENVAGFDIFGHLRNFVKWLLFDSFLYDLFSPFLDPIYNLINDIQVFIYSVITMLGGADIYYNTTSQFLVNMLFNFFMLYVVFKMINFFG